jgi:hypothetical protein
LIKNVLEICKKTIIFVFILFVFDYIIGFSMDYLFFHQNSGKYHIINKAIFDTNYDLLIFGSSNATHHIIPKLLDDSLKINSANIGQDGQDIIYNKFILSLILKKYIPKYIILVVSSYDLTNALSFEHLEAILPYVKFSPNSDLTISYKGKYELFKMLSHTYPFNSKLHSIIKGLSQDSDSNKGFVPLYGNYKGEIPEIIKSEFNYIIDSNRVRAFNEFVSLTKNNGINLLIIISPYIHNLYDNTDSRKYIFDYCTNNKINCLEYSGLNKFLIKKDLFIDEGHLNLKGATILTEDIIRFIKDKASYNIQ